jgi:hypothetical protein
MDRHSHKAQIPNPALKQLSALVGDWRTVGSHPLVGDNGVKGKSTFGWIEGGAFLIWHSEMEDKRFPAGIAIFGSEDATGELYMLYFDERKVSRKYDVSVEGNVVRWWRNARGFFQRYSWTISDNGNTIIGKGELCKDGKNWERDLEQTFTRVG